MGVERRRAPRIEVLGRLHGHVVSLNAAVTVREISLVGLSFSAPMPFPLNAEHDFRLTLGDGSAVLLRGRIMRCQDAHAPDGQRTYVMGVQFVDEDAPETEPGTISSVVNRLK
jgi:hypothetical protein